MDKCHIQGLRIGVASVCVYVCLGRGCGHKCLDLHTGAMTLVVGNNNKSSKANKELDAKPILYLLSSGDTGVPIFSGAQRLRPIHFENL